MHCVCPRRGRARGRTREASGGTRTGDAERRRGDEVRGVGEGHDGRESVKDRAKLVCGEAINDVAAFWVTLFKSAFSDRARHEWLW